MVAAIFLIKLSLTELCAACCRRVVCPMVDDNSFLTALDLSLASAACDMATLHSAVRGLARRAMLGITGVGTGDGLGAELERICFLGIPNGLCVLGRAAVV